MKLLLIADPADQQEVRQAQEILTSILEKCPQIGNSAFVISIDNFNLLVKDQLNNVKSISTQLREMPTEDLINKILNGNQFKTNSKRQDFDKHLEALLRAKKAALAADPGNDGGTCNFDSAVIWLKGWTADDVRELQKLSGVRIGEQRTSRMWRGARSIDVSSGQGYQRTQMSEAAWKSLQADGIECSMFYQVD